MNNKEENRGILGKKLLFLITTIIILLIIGITFIKAYGDTEVSYYPLNSPQMIIPIGPPGSFDHLRTHTLSVVELNKNGYRFWGYYTGWDGIGKDSMGLIYSNDLINWVKDSSEPIIPNLRWGTAVVDDGIIHMFGTRNYGGDSYIVRLTSQDGKNFTEEKIVVPAVKGQKHQNPFIFYDETNQVYRLYYFHLKGKDNIIEEKHSPSITQLALAEPHIILSENNKILAAPSIFYRDNKYWLTAETLSNRNNKWIWETIAYFSGHPIYGFVQVSNHEILQNDDACFFPFVFDNQLNGFYSHRYDNDTWVLFRTTHDFAYKNKIKLNENTLNLKVGEMKQLIATAISPNGIEKNVTGSATWATSDNWVASVQDGKVVAKEEGTAVITASYGGVSTTSVVRIYQTLESRAEHYQNGKYFQTSKQHADGKQHFGGVRQRREVGHGAYQTKARSYIA